MNEVVVVNEKDEVIGTMPREDAHRNGTPHRVSVIYVTNSQGKILIQVRMSGRLDHSSAGHVDPGETYKQTAYRELKEELGIDGVTLKEIGSGISHDKFFDKKLDLAHVFKVFVCTAEPKQLQKNEVKSVYWKDPVELLKEMKNDESNSIYTEGFKKSLPIYLKFSGFPLSRE